MDQAMHLWAWWLSLWSAFAPAFTRPGWVRFVPWVTGMVLCWEEHTLTQILTALGLESRWRVLEHFAEDGAWDRAAIERYMPRWLERERPARWGGYHPVALEDTKLHRTSKQVWGTCTCHAASARSPNRAETVRAHNWVVMGTLLPGRPRTSLGLAARLYGRHTPWPTGEPCRTQTALAVELWRQADAESAAPVLGVFEGASAVDTVIRPCLGPVPGQRHIAIGTRLRADARLDHPVAVKTRPKGRRPVWGPRIAAPRHHRYWPVSWQQSRAWGHGQTRSFLYKQLRCRWAVSGPQNPGHVLVIHRVGYKEPGFLIPSALELSAAPVGEAWAARFRQEDGFRDHKPRLGMEDCRAWTKEPSLRTFQVQLVALTLLRLLQSRLIQAWGPESGWLTPEWNRRKRHASLLDLRRLFWRYRAAFSQFLIDLEGLEKTPQPLASPPDLSGRAA
jgi:DDE superfamily endonuclease